MSTYFEHPLFLFVSLFVIPAGLFFFYRFKKIEQSLLPIVSREESQSDFLLSRMVAIRFVLFSCAWIFLCCAAASPRWGTEFVATRQEGYSVVFVMDISRSMGVSDISPDRLTFASRYATLLTEQMKTTPCAVVLVKGSAILALPLTTDHRSVLDLLSSLSPSMLSSPGSGLGLGVKTALAAFPRNSAASRTIILFTDGDETTSSLEAVAREVRTDGATLVIVGVGTVSGAELNVFPGQEEKRMQRTVLREDILKKTAHAAGAGSFYISGSETGSALRILQAANPPVRDSRKLVYSQRPVYRYFEFLFAAILCFSAGFIAGGLVWRKK